MVVQAIRGEAKPVISEARRKFDEAQIDYLSNGDWFAEETPRLRLAEEAVSEAVLKRAERSRAVAHPTGLILIDESGSDQDGRLGAGA